MKRYALFTRALALSSALVLAAGGYAFASGFYVGVQGGATLLDGITTHVAIPNGPTAQANTNTDTGWLAGASGGYEWPIGLALEGEFTYRQNHLNDLNYAGENIFTGGDAHSYAMMMNGYYRWHNRTRFTPYIGGGVGEAVVALNNLHPNAPGGDFGGDTATFAYQAIGGVAYALNEHWSIAAEYRYFATVSPGISGNTAGIKNVKLSPGYGSQNALLRLIYNF
jgi:outer membrane immunogenic protein